MTTTTSSSSPSVQQHRWRLVGLLSVSVLINYLDRGNLSVAAPVLARELSLSPAQLGLLFSAFFWTYAIAQIPAGWLVDRVSVYRLYAGAYFLWCLATLLVGFAHTVTILLFARLLLGLGESVVYPVCSQLLVRNFSEQERGRANSFIDIGTKAGPALSSLLGGLVVAYWGWRTLFFATGVISLLWLLPWHFSASGSTTITRQPEKPGAGMIEILARRDMVGTSLGLFCYGYVWYFILSWLPSYLMMERNFSIRAMAVFAALPLCATGVSTLACGWASDYLIGLGLSASKVRKSFVVTGLLVCTLLLPASIVRNVPLAMCLLTVACAALGLFSSNVWAITQTLAGPSAAGKWSGMQNAAGNLGGVASPLVTGLIVSRTHSFFLAFVCAVVALLLGAAAYLFVVGEIRPLRWKEQGAMELSPGAIHL